MIVRVDITSFLAGKRTWFQTHLNELMRKQAMVGQRRLEILLY
jgi:hypothetical protein